MGEFSDAILGGGQAPAATAPPGDFSSALLGGAEVRSAGAHPVAGRREPLNPADDPSRQAGALTQAAASLPTDLGARTRYFARQRFPGDPKAMERYFVKDGRIGYVADDGKPYWEEPGAYPTSVSGTGKYVASLAGPSLPMAGATAGGIATAPFLGGAPGAAAGGAGGDAARQGLASAVVGDTGYSPLQTAKEGALGAGGQVLGKLAVVLGNSRVARDLAKIATPEAEAAIAQLVADAKRLGVDLTPAEITNLRSLRGQQRVLQDLPASADEMGDFYARRNTEQVPKAVDDTLSTISPERSIEMGATRLQQGAKAAIQSRKDARAEMSPYGDALQSPAEVEVQPIIDAIDARTKTAKGEIKDVLKKAWNYLHREVESVDSKGNRTVDLTPDTSVAGLHEAKLAIDALIEGRGDQAVSGVAKRELVSMQKQLIDAIERAEPKYATARANFREGSPAVEELTEGLVGKAADATPLNLSAAPKSMFEASPAMIRQNRLAFERSGRADDWNAGLRAYLEEGFDKASKEYASGNVNPGARFRARVYGTKVQREALRSAMTDEQWQGFTGLMNVLEATGRVPQGGSMTAFNQEAIKEMRDQSGAAVRRLAGLASPQNVGAKLGEWAEGIFMGRHAAKLAEVITKPDAMTKLKELRKLSPTSERARMIAGQVLAAGGFAAGEDLFQEDVPPGGMK